MGHVYRPGTAIAGDDDHHIFSIVRIVSYAAMPWIGYFVAVPSDVLSGQIHRRSAVHRTIEYPHHRIDEFHAPVEPLDTDLYHAGCRFSRDSVITEKHGNLCGHIQIGIDGPHARLVINVVVPIVVDYDLILIVVIHDAWITIDTGRGIVDRVERRAWRIFPSFAVVTHDYAWKFLCWIAIGIWSECHPIHPSALVWPRRIELDYRWMDTLPSKIWSWCRLICGRI